MKYSRLFTKVTQRLVGISRNEQIKPVPYALLTFLITILPVLQVAAVTIDPSPVFTQYGVKPNIITLVDDSGSMDSEVLFPTNDGALWWNTSDDAYEDGADLQRNFGGGANSTYKKYTYLFPNGTGTGRRVYSDSTNDHYAIPPIVQYAYARSSDYNKSYYDPDVTYDPWVSGGSTTFSDVSPSAAPADPATATGVTLNLTANYESSSSNYTFKMHDQSVIPDGTYYHDGSSWGTAGSDVTLGSTQNIGIRYFPATYYVKVTTGTYTVDGNGGNCSTPDSSHHALLRASPGTFTSSNVDSLAYDGGCLKKVEIKSANAPFTNAGSRTDCATAASCTYAEEIQNFANWYSYYRKRHMALRAGMGAAFDGLTATRVGVIPINHRSNVTMIDFDTSSNTFFNTIYDLDGNSGGTPNRTALKYAGDQYMRTTDGPVTDRCQKNFTIQFTDGFSTTTDDGLNNVDEDEGVPYADSYSDTLADIAMYYYNTNIRSDFTPGEVPVASGCSESTPDPQLDCNTNLHMNTYTVGLAAVGDSVFNVTHFDVADAYDTAPTWPNVNNTRDRTQVDDLYHAAVNGRGEMYSADTPKELQTALTKALTSIAAQTGSGASATFNSSTLESESMVFLGLFDSAGWSGDLQAYTLDEDGKVETPYEWSAATELDDRNLSTTPRTVITYNGSDGIPFTWTGNIADLGSGNILYDDLTYDSGNGEERLDYIRGDRSNEGEDVRVRTSRLGDIVHSAAVFVGQSDLNWPDILPPGMTTPGDIYSVFVADTGDRDPVIYVGANDGMLHGFDAETGDEVLAYIPGAIYSDQANEGLHYLTDDNYSHRFYVDATPTLSDIVVGTDWTTVLIGALGAGGKGLFALDVTDPANFSEANAADIVLWEFTSDNDSDLGNTFSAPTVAMTNNGKWAAIFGNGYNSTGGDASLFILYIADGIDGWTAGTDYVELSTGTTGTGNGLSTPAVIDVDGDGDADMVYAGDLNGDLWKFDISDADSANWTTTKLFDGADTQPITVMPDVAYHYSVESDINNSPNVMIFFGTGQYLSSNDIATTDTQAFYGIWDDGSVTSSPLTAADDLQKQTIVAVDGGLGRIIDAETVDYEATGADKEYGWYIELPDSGERVVTDSVARGSNVFFTTAIPTTDPCDYGGSSWNMVVDGDSGGPPQKAAFDYDNDGVVGDDDDYVDHDGEDTALSGEKNDDGLGSGPSVLGDKQYITTTTTEGGEDIDVRDIEELDGKNTGRLSWDELFY